MIRALVLVGVHSVASCAGIVSVGGIVALHVFFFSSRRRHTRFDCDWSSDVCSSDLPGCPWPPAHLSASSQDLPDVVARIEIGDELLQVRAERVARRHHAERLAVLHHRHVPELAFVHQVQRVPERPVGRDGARIQRHDLGKVGLRRVAALGEHAEQRVALGENAGEPAALHDQQRADAMALHQLRRRRDAGFGASENGLLLPNDAADRSFFHGTPPRADTLLSVRSIALQIFFCIAKISIKIFPCARNISFPWATAAFTASPTPSGAITTIRTSWCACTVLRATAAISTSSPRRSPRTAAWCAWMSSDAATATGWKTSPNTAFPPTWPTRRRCWRG